MRSLPAILFLLTLTPHASAADPCTVRKLPPDWQVFISAANKFCFQYPPSYVQIPAVGKTAVALLDNPRNHAAIRVDLLSEPFRLSQLAKEFGPTGVESGPSAVRIGLYTFYLYGKVGSGAHYPDVYFFDLSGRTLRITFDGPYDGLDKSPVKATQVIEQKLLASFQLF